MTKRELAKKIKLPLLIDDFSDYHEIPMAGKLFTRLIPGIKYKELRSVSSGYTGIFYMIQDSEYQKMITKHEQRVKDEEE